ncbi:MAG TPA: hypothetical protein VEC06_19835 [Paucimonas sp.]|nr:hypothetical protein [Paucimonas sp.]
MSNLQSAKSAIKAEIAHAKEGLNFYKSRVEILEQTLSQLDSVGAPETTPASRGRKARKHAQAPASNGRTGRQRRGRKAQAEAGQELPFTGGDYWFNLIGDEPRSAAEILKAAVDSLGFEPSKEQVQKLRQRLTPALQGLLETKRIQDSGAGRERRYFLAQES